MKKFIWPIIGGAVIIVAIVLALTNPSKADFSAWVQSKVQKNAGDSMLDKMAEGMTGPIVDAVAVRNNYVVFSVFKLDDKKFIGILKQIIPTTEMPDDAFARIRDEQQTVLESPENAASDNSVASDKRAALKTQMEEAVQGEKSTGGEQVDRAAASDRMAAVQADAEKALSDKISAGANQTASQNESFSYINARFGFAIKIPAGFESESAPENGDSLAFINHQDETIIMVSGTNLASGETIAQEYEKCIDSISGEISYKECTDNFYVVSWSENGIICYQKTFVGKNSENTFLIMYNQQVRSVYDPMIAQIVESFKSGDLASGH